MRRLRTLLTLTAALSLAGATLASTGTAMAASRPGASTTYVVVLRDNTDPSAVAGEYTRRGGRLQHVYSHALKGFALTLDATAAAALRRDPRVVSVEVDQVVTIAAQDVPTGIRRVFADDNTNLKINGQDDFRADVDVAILDTGVDFDHPDLNVVARTDCANRTSCVDNSGDDAHGHGSHVAGTVAAIDNSVGVVGVAPGSRIWSVKVLGDNASGTLAGVAAGVDWVAAHADEIEVVNLSLGCDGCTDSALTTAISNAVNKGIVFTVAAGNNSKDAKTFFPANHPDVITVSALADFNGEPGGGAASTCRTDQDDTLASFSNFGPTVEIAAPGTCIYSTYKDGGYTTMSGTSMAAPHVAGAAALLASGTNKPVNRQDVQRIRDRLLETANTNWTDDSGDNVKEPLLDVSSTADFPSGPPDPSSPNAAFTFACTTANNTCTFDAGNSADPDGSLTSYAWDFGDNTTGTGRTTSHTYQQSGSYSVKLTVTDNSGKKDAVRREVKAGDLPPTASFTGSCWLATCQFDGSASSDGEGAIASYQWNFGDNTTGTGRTTSHTYPNVTVQYRVTLTVRDSRNQSSTAFVRQVWCYWSYNRPQCYWTNL